LYHRAGECHDAFFGRSSGSPAATICAMSSSFGGDCVSAPSASRNIDWQNGQAVPIVCAPVPSSSSARSTLMRLAFSSPRNIWPPPLLDKLLALAGGEAGGVAVALRVEEQPSAALVLPLASVHGTATLSDAH